MCRKEMYGICVLSVRCVRESIVVVIMMVLFVVGWFCFRCEWINKSKENRAMNRTEQNRRYEQKHREMRLDRRWKKISTKKKQTNKQIINTNKTIKNKAI